MHSAVLIVGSSPTAPVCAGWHLANVRTIALNNAWRLRSDFDYSFYPPDFPVAQHAPHDGPTRHIQADVFLQSLAECGGRVFTGATMAFAAGYWAYTRLTPPLLAYAGCDMTYSPVDGKTHFYGTGTADPLRVNISLRSLEAKSCRLFIKALLRGTLVVNVSGQPESRLVFPRVPPTLLECWQRQAALLAEVTTLPMLSAIQDTATQIEEQERRAPFEAFQVGKIPPTAANLAFVDDLDRQWLNLQFASRQIEQGLLTGLSAARHPC